MKSIRFNSRHLLPFLKLLIVFRVLPSVSYSAENKFRVEIEISGFLTNQGKGRVFLYSDQDRLFDLKNGRTQNCQIKQQKCRVAFESIIPAEYAIFVFHDENNNDIPDHTFFGIPSESMAFSNHFVPSLFTGKPRFKDIKITIHHNREIKIKFK